MACIAVSSVIYRGTHTHTHIHERSIINLIFFFPFSIYFLIVHRRCTINALLPIFFSPFLYILYMYIHINILFFFSPFVFWNFSFTCPYGIICPYLLLLSTNWLFQRSTAWYITLIDYAQNLIYIAPQMLFTLVEVHGWALLGFLTLHSHNRQMSAVNIIAYLPI